MTWVVVFSNICYFHPYLGVSKNREYPKWMVYNGKLYILRWDDLGVPLFSETSIWGNDPPTRFFHHFCWCWRGSWVSLKDLAEQEDFFGRHMNLDPVWDNLQFPKKNRVAVFFFVGSFLPMFEGNGACKKRPRSPSPAMEKGRQVLFFYESDASDPQAPLVNCGTPKNPNQGGFRFAGSHAWLHGTLDQPFDGKKRGSGTKGDMAKSLAQSRVLLRNTKGYTCHFESTFASEMDLNC